MEKSERIERRWQGLGFSPTTLAINNAFKLLREEIEAVWLAPMQGFHANGELFIWMARQIESEKGGVESSYVDWETKKDLDQAKAFSRIKKGFRRDLIAILSKAGDQFIVDLGKKLPWPEPERVNRDELYLD